MNAPAKQLKKLADDIGIGTREMTSATTAPQNGDKLRIAEMIIGCELREAEVIQYETAHPDREYDRERPVI